MPVTKRGIQHVSVFVCVLVLAATNTLCAEAIEGDAELLRQVAYALRHNNTAMQTWQGRAERSIEMYKIADADTAKEPDNKDTQQVSFYLDRVRDIARADVNFNIAGLGQRQFANTVRRNDGSFHRFFGGADKPEQGQLILEKFSDRRPDYFDPLRCQNYDADAGQSWETAQMLLFRVDEFIRNPARDPQGAMKVSRTGDLVAFTIESIVGQAVNVWTFDLASGGSLVGYYAKGRNGYLEVKITYQNLAGVWVPTEHFWKSVNKATGDKPGMTLIKRTVLHDQSVNVPIDPAVFTIESLGVRVGTTITDWRSPNTPIVSKYSGTVPADLLRMVNLAASRPTASAPSATRYSAAPEGMNRMSGGSDTPAADKAYSRRIILSGCAIGAAIVLLIAMRVRKFRLQGR